jgi:hypothetical protein
MRLIFFSRDKEEEEDEVEEEEEEEDMMVVTMTMRDHINSSPLPQLLFLLRNYYQFC